MPVEFIRAKPQTVWRWPAVLNFVLGGTGAGLFLAALLLVAVDDPSQSHHVFRWAQLLAPALVVLGFAGLSLEAGRPMRARFLLRGLGHSWTSRETLAAVVFVGSSMVCWWWPRPAWLALAAAGAMALLLTHGFIFLRCRAVPAWNTPRIIPVFITSGLATGVGLLLVLSGHWQHAALVFGMSVLVLDIAVWAAYVNGSGDVALHQAMRRLRRRLFGVLLLGVLRGGPVLLLAAATGGSVDAANVLIALAGGLAVLGGIIQKAGVIRAAGRLRAIELPAPELLAHGASADPMTAVPVRSKV